MSWIPWVLISQIWTTPTPPPACSLLQITRKFWKEMETKHLKTTYLGSQPYPGPRFLDLRIPNPLESVEDYDAKLWRITLTQVAAYLAIQRSLSLQHDADFLSEVDSIFGELEATLSGAGMALELPVEGLDGLWRFARALGDMPSSLARSLRALLGRLMRALMRYHPNTTFLNVYARAGRFLDGLAILLAALDLGASASKALIFYSFLGTVHYLDDMVIPAAEHSSAPNQYAGLSRAIDEADTVEASLPGVSEGISPELWLRFITLGMEGVIAIATIPALGALAKVLSLTGIAAGSAVPPLILVVLAVWGVSTTIDGAEFIYFYDIVSHHFALVQTMINDAGDGETTYGQILLASAALLNGVDLLETHVIGKGAISGLATLFPLAENQFRDWIQTQLEPQRAWMEGTIRAILEDAEADREQVFETIFCPADTATADSLTVPFPPFPDSLAGFFDEEGACTPASAEDLLQFRVLVKSYEEGRISWDEPLFRELRKRVRCLCRRNPLEAVCENLWR